ncbi:hypothetical protein FHG87_020949 [Trinorchestia longiramus]|nr:hypothetical protein FHG87_020949 [Trinorchestia longiramus]
MGNQSSRNHHHPPATWTQSFPRDNRRLQKMGVTTENRVLPERVSVQRLRPTENGRSLQVAGTITGRRAGQTIEPHPLHTHPMGHQSLPGFAPPMSSPCPAHPHGPPASLMHSNSMTHLHQQCALHPSPRMEHSRSGSMHELRFGYPPSKVYTSEPDLRVGGNSTVPLPVPHSPHTIVSQSPTKGRIKSKKRNRAPPPPANGVLSDEYIPDNSRAGSEVQRAVHWGTSDTQSRPPSQVSSSKSKSRKLGLFKKKNDGRKSDNDSCFTDDQSKSKYNRNAMSGLSKQEKRERARSVDCLQNELRHSSNLNMVETSLMGSSSDEASSSSRGKDPRPRSQTIERDSRRTPRENSVERRLSTTIDRNPRHQSLDHQRKYEEFRSHNKLEERRSHDSQHGRQFVGPYDLHNPKELGRRASYSIARPEKPIDRAFEEWDKAEREELRRKRISDTMKNEILSVGKNLKKPSPVGAINKADNFENSFAEENGKPSGAGSNSGVDKDSPKMFFFGMEPSVAGGAKPTSPKSSPTRIVENEQVRIEGNSVEFSKRNAEVIERSRSQSRSRNFDSEVAQVPAKTEETQRISNDLDNFAISVERRSRNNFGQGNLLNSFLKREDGGYHSRQNSGSFHLENENPSDEDLGGVTVNLRPILPKRQREIPRFSPNAAWRFLGEEPFLPGENLNESRSSEEVDPVFEDKIRGFSRPIAPPRGSGEKSADSGISGDAGSPGPMQEFETIKVVSGPLAASSPVASGRLEARRAWTPAQDLDENSLDGSGEPTVHRTTQNERLSTPPKLTSRANMFNLFGLKEYRSVTGFQNSDEEAKTVEASKTSTTIDESTQTLLNFRKLKRSVSGSANITSNPRNVPEDKSLRPEARTVQNDKWRENWSMTRSIPNSLNNCKESDCLVKRESRVGEDRQNSQFLCMNSEGNSASSRLPTSSYLQNSQATGHIMYLPEYNSLKVPYDDISVREIRSKDLNSAKHLSRSTMNENLEDFIGENEESQFLAKSNGPILMPGFSPVGRLKKGRKFSYQSTVRVLEKKKIEEQLNKEVAAKEQQRLQEAAAMKRVEEEFQLKREREKKRLKQQLKLYQVMQGADDLDDQFSGSFMRSSSIDNPNDQKDSSSSAADQEAAASCNSQRYRHKSTGASAAFHAEIPNGYQSSNSSFINDRSRSDPHNSTKEKSERNSRVTECRERFYETKESRTDFSHEESLKNNSSRRCSGDDTTSSSVSSVSHGSDSVTGGQQHQQRPAPEGAPAALDSSLPGRTEGLFTARHRSGIMTQELSEHQQPRREYREYRRSQRPSSAQGGISDNYRRDFSRGQAQVALDDRSCRQSYNNKSQCGLLPPPAETWSRYLDQLRLGLDISTS